MIDYGRGDMHVTAASTGIGMQGEDVGRRARNGRGTHQTGNDSARRLPQ
jgi:hypothetical protein